MFKFLIFFGLACIVSAAAKQVIDITLYYEPLCPDSRAFFKDQLVPTYHDLYQAVDLNLKLIPFGKAKITNYDPNNFTMECRHGSVECFADKVHACAINIYGRDNEKKLIDYLDCLMRNADEVPYPTQRCGSENQIDFGRLGACTNTTTQVNMFLKQNEMDTKSLSPPLTSVPTVVFNNKFVRDDNDKSQKNFKGILCKYIDSPKPKACEGLSSASAVTAGGAILFLSLALNMLR